MLGHGDARRAECRAWLWPCPDDSWSWVEGGVLVVMWTVMMIAMMTPAAAPMILMFSAIHRRRTAEGRPAVPTAIFILGYLVVWMIYSVVAALGKLVFTPPLSCRRRWRPRARCSPAVCWSLPACSSGRRSSARARRLSLTVILPHDRLARGPRRGVCDGLAPRPLLPRLRFALMALLFVAAVMNLLWVAVIAVALLVEKVVPRGDLVGRLAGVVLIAAGVLLVAGGVIG